MNKQVASCLMLFCALVLVKQSKATVEEALALIPSSMRAHGLA